MLTGSWEGTGLAVGHSDSARWDLTDIKMRYVRNGDSFLLCKDAKFYIESERDRVI